jgi:hypothetical protein
MRKGVIATVAFCFVLCLLAMPAAAKKAGEIKDNVYTDSDYGFSFQVPSGWSVNIKASKSALRLAMNQTSPIPPRHFEGDLRDYMQIPVISVLVDTCSVPVDTFIHRLQDAGYKSKQKEYFMTQLKLISKPHEIMKSKDVTLGSDKGTILQVRQAYMTEVAQRGSDRADVINDYKAGSVLFTVRGGHVYIFHMICEYQSSEPILTLFDAMINSLKFSAAAPAEEKGKGD